MRKATRSTFWIAAFVLLTVAPLLIILAGPRPAGRQFWRDFSVGLGFAGLSLMGMQSVPTARLRFLSDAFPMDTLYYFHHRISLISLALMVAHPLILILNNPHVLRLLNVFRAPTTAQAGVIALLAAAVLVYTSVWRKEVRLKYEPWKALHGFLALGALVLAYLHIFGVRYYTATLAQQVLWVLLAALWLGMLLYVRVLKPLALARRPYAVREVIPERGDAYTVTLDPLGHSGMAFRAGQFAWLKVQSSPFSIMEHPFSFSSSASQGGAMQFTIRELGDFTSTVKDVPPGARVWVDGPYGTFGVDDYADAPGLVFLAGGVGIVPFRSILRTLADRGDERPIILIYGSYSWDVAIFREELEELRQRLNLRVVHTLEAPPPDWRGEKGYINAAMLARHLPTDRDGWRYLLCGPLAMIHAVEAALQQVGVPRGQVHSELYDMA